MGYKNLKIDGLAIFSFTCLIIYMDPSAGLHTLMAYVLPFENLQKNDMASRMLQEWCVMFDLMGMG